MAACVSGQDRAIYHKVTLYAGKVLAAAAIELLQNPHIVDEAKQELSERLGGDNYECPIPPDVAPSLKR